MKPWVSLSCAILTILALTTIASCATTPAQKHTVATAASATLLNTQWRLTTLDGQVIENPASPRAVYFTMQSQATNVTGFSGCNRLTGRYALESDTLKFDGMGGTRMACAAGAAGADLERRLLAMFAKAARWKIVGQTLELQDADGRPLASFEAQPVAAP